MFKMLYLIVVFAIIYILFRWNFRKFIKVSKIFKNDYWSVPLLGISYKFFGNDEDRMKALQSFGREAIKHGGITSGWFGHRFFVAVADPEVAEFLFKNCLEKDDIMRILRLVLGNSNFLAPVPIWRIRRKVLLPTFNPVNLNRYVKVFAEQSQSLVDQLRPVVGKPVPIFSYISSYSLDAIFQTTLGVKLQKRSDTEHPFIKAIKYGSEALATRLLQPWLHIDFVYKLLPRHKTLMKHRNFMFDFVGEIIESQKKRAESEKERKAPKDKRVRSFTELLIEASADEKGYTDLVMTEEAVTIIIAGTDTSAVATSFMALLLARHPDVQTKVYQELKEVLGNSERPVEPDDLPHLKYMDAVVRECLRLYPPVPVLARKADKDITLPSGVELPKGCGILMHLWAINRNPRYWGADADEFRPERFLDPSPKHPGQFMSFGHGPRNCAGYSYAMMSTKTMLATLLRQYRLLPAPETTPDKPIRTQFEIMMKEVNNFPIILESR